jgi:hypothetical protein
METKNALITDAVLGINGAGFLDARILLDYGDGDKHVFGDYGLYAYKDGVAAKDYTGYFICCVLEIAGVYKWDQLIGKAIRVTGDERRIAAIGHIIQDVWFYPDKEFEQLRQNVSA